MSRPRRQQAPDWPKSLQLPAVEAAIEAKAQELRVPAAMLAPAVGSSVAAADVAARADTERQQARFRALVDEAADGRTPMPAPLTAFLFVRTRDGRHLAAEAQVTGDKVTALTPLCCSIHAQESAKAWEACAFARMCHGREYSATELHANSVQGKGARVEDVAEGYAVALVKRAGKTVALAMEVEGATVKEPKVLGSGDRLYAWQEAHAFAQRWFLPRRKAK